MIIKRIDLYSKDQTAKEMYRIVENFFNDIENFFFRSGERLIPINQLSLFRFFDMVRCLPYRKDKKPIEITARPYYLLTSASGGLDCKKKAIIMASYLKSNGIPYRFIASSKKPSKKIHHVFPQALLDGEWKNLDATYKRFHLFEPKTVTNAEVLTW